METMTLAEFAKHNQEPKWLQVKRQVVSQMAATLPLDAKQREYCFAVPNLTPQSVNPENQAPTGLAEQGVLMMDLFAAARQYPNFVQENLMEKAIEWRENSLNARHLAFIQSGAFIYLPPDTVIEQPLDISDLIDQQVQEKHILIIAGANCKATFMFDDQERNNNDDCLMTEVLLGDNAHVKYYDAANSNAQHNHRVLNAYLAQNAQLKTYVGLFNRYDTRYDSNLSLDGQSSEGAINIVSLGDGDQKQSIYADIINESPNTRGEIKERGIVAGHAKTHCYTNGIIHEDGYNGYSNQSSRLLTLDETSRGEVDPVLLIDNYDVVAGHAASVGKVDTEQLYYLNSRGIPLREAKVLLTRGFLLPLVNEFPNRAVRDQMFAKLEGRFNVE